MGRGCHGTRTPAPGGRTRPRTLAWSRADGAVRRGSRPAVYGAGDAVPSAGAERPPSQRLPPAPMPDFVPPMTATLSDRAFSDPGWLFEVKWDGYRVEAVVRAGTVATVDPQPWRRRALLPGSGVSGADLDRRHGRDRGRRGRRARRRGATLLLAAPGAGRLPATPRPRRAHRLPGLRPPLPRR